MSLQIWMPMTDGTSANQGLMDATIENTKIVANANGKLGKCCEFNGTDSRILINGDFGKTVLGGEWTVCMWIYDTKGAARGSYFTTYGITPGISTGLSIEKTAAKALRVYWNASPDWNTGYTIPDEQWFHLAVVHKEESCYIYINGEFITSRSNGFKVVSVGNYTKAAIGRDYRTTTPAHKGRIQDFRFYTSALSDRQIKKISQGLLMHFSLSGYGYPADNLYSYYTGDNTIEYDLSGNGYDAIKNNITQDYNTPRNVSCAVFNGTDSWIKIQTNSWMVQRSPELTISFWAYSDDWKTKYTRMFSCTESGGFNTEKGTTGYMRFVIDVYTTEASSSRAYQYSNTSIKLSDLSAGWHMFSFTYNKDFGNKTYLDGVLVEDYEAVSYGTHFNTTNCFLYLGCEANYKNPYTPFFNGKMSDFRIYYTALPADEIKLLYDGNLSGGDTE